jgi:hypothetical protein
MSIVGFTLELDGDVSSFTPSVRTEMKSAIAVRAGVDPSAVELTISAGSVIADVSIQAYAVTAASVHSTMASATRSPSSASAMLANVTGVSIVVLAVVTPPTVEEIPPPPPPSPSPPPPTGPSAVETSDPTGVIIGVIVGIIVALALALVFMRRRRRNQPPQSTKVKLGSSADRSATRRPSKSSLAVKKEGFALRALRPETDASELQSLEALLQIDLPKWLGWGKDQKEKYGPYDSLKLACAWKVDHPSLMIKYAAGKQRVQQEIELLGENGKNVKCVPGWPVKTARARGFTLSQDCNEVILLHGTNPENLLDLLSTGLNERYSGTNVGTNFGDGVYLAEDAGKTDQYVSADSMYDPNSELHKRLYDETVPHPDDVFYVLAVRAALGFPVRTQYTGKSATSMDTGAPIFPVNYRELSAVPGVMPRILHHSLIAELGKNLARYREFVFFHSEYVHIDYVIAYHRYKGDKKLCTTDRPYQA